MVKYHQYMEYAGWWRHKAVSLPGLMRKKAGTKNEGIKNTGYSHLQSTALYRFIGFEYRLFAEQHRAKP